MRDDFNKEAMREKIRRNLEKGFSLDGIKEALLQERLSIAERLAVLMARDEELADQLEFMEKEHGDTREDVDRAQGPERPARQDTQQA